MSSLYDLVQQPQEEEETKSSKSGSLLKAVPDEESMPSDAQAESLLSSDVARKSQPLDEAPGKRSFISLLSDKRAAVQTLNQRAKEERNQGKKPTGGTPTIEEIKDTASPEDQKSIDIMMADGNVDDATAQRMSTYLTEPEKKGLFAQLSPDRLPNEKAFDLVTTPNPDGIGLQDVVNFLVGDEMAVLGMKYDNNSFGWQWENARKQWAEEPLWINALATTSLVGTVAFPAIRALTQSAKAGRIAKLLGTYSKADEVAALQAIDWIPKTAAWKDVPEELLRKLRTNLDARTKHIDFEAKKLAESEGTLQKGMVLPSGQVFGPVDKLKWHFDKNFTNTYFENLASISKTGAVKKEYAGTLDKLWKNEKIGRFFTDLPDEARGTAIYANLLAKVGRNLDINAVIKRARPTDSPEELVKYMNSLKLNPQEQVWADTMYDAMKIHQDEALKIGLITPEMHTRIGDIHLPAFAKDSATDFSSSRKLVIPVKNLTIKPAIAGEPAQRVLKTVEFPRLDAPQIRHRTSEMGEVADRLFSGKLLTDPEKLTMSGYVIDRLMSHNFQFIRDHATQFGRKEADVIQAFGSTKKAEEKGWISLSKLRNGVPEVESTLRRMLKTSGQQIGDLENLPYIHKSHFDAIFGKGGVFEQTQHISNSMNMLTAVMKTAKTVFNIPTHGNNLIGNFVMMSMAGYNPLAPKNLDVMSTVTKSFIKWADAHDGIIRAGKKAEDLFDPITRRLKGVDLGRVEVRGKMFDLNDEFLDPMVKDVIGEESAFLHAEGLHILQDYVQHAKKGGVNGIGRAFAAGLLKAKDSTKFTKQAFDDMTKAYLGEDVVPKLAYYLDMRALGMTKEAAVLETGRRLPVYSTVGKAIADVRGTIWFPWATFPSEAMRIMKNNMMDHPIRMLPWMHLPGILQTGLSATGLAPSTYGEVEERKRQLPTWAQTSYTAVTNKEGSNVMAHGAGAVTGAVVGGAIGGAKGAAVGAAAGGALPTRSAIGAGVLGAAGGILAGRPGALAGAAIGGLAGLASKAMDEHDIQGGEEIRGATLRWLPWSAIVPASNSPEYTWDLQGAMQQLPAEPLAIIKPLIEVFSGKTGFGQDIQASGLPGQIGASIAGLIGWMMPPVFQKYGFKLTMPEKSVSEALLGHHIPGDITNVSRFYTDTGLETDPNTGNPGNLDFDFLMNNTSGLWQSYAVKPESRLLNEARQDDALGKIRGYWTRQLDYHALNSNWDAVNVDTDKIFSSFATQYAADPAMAQTKFGEFIKQHLGVFGRHPGLKSFSEEELAARFEKASKFAAEHRSNARKDEMSLIQRERAVRGLK